MKRKLLLSAAGATAAVFLAYGSAQAAPAAGSGSLDALKTLGLEQSNIAQAHRRCYRRCWRTKWGWRCRRWCRY
jgi:hypothetical protein